MSGEETHLHKLIQQSIYAYSIYLLDNYPCVFICRARHLHDLGVNSNQLTCFYQKQRVGFDQHKLGQQIESEDHQQ